MLYIIATPIGNLKDIGLRAVETFEEIDVLLCEDTRKTGLLLVNLGIKNKPRLISFYDEVEEQKIPEIIKLLKQNQKVGLVSDAGTPIISDPGYKLVKKCQKMGFSVTSVPGPSAVINALVLSGISGGRFCFLGFLPKKTTERKKVLKRYQEFEGSKVVYESPFRLIKLITDIIDIYGEETEISICREMTKKFEEVISGTAKLVFEKIKNKKVKGELVVIF